MTRGELINARARVGARMVELRERLKRVRGTSDDTHNLRLKLELEVATAEIAYKAALKAEEDWKP